MRIVVEPVDRITVKKSGKKKGKASFNLEFNPCWDWYKKLFDVTVYDDDGKEIAANYVSINRKGKITVSRQSYADPTVFKHAHPA